MTSIQMNAIINKQLSVVAKIVASASYHSAKKHLGYPSAFCILIILTEKIIHRNATHILKKRKIPQLAWRPSAAGGGTSEGDKGENKKPRKQAMACARGDYIFDGKLGPGCGGISIRRKGTVHTVQKNKFFESF